MSWPQVPLGELCVARTGTEDPGKRSSGAFVYVDIGSVDVATKTITGARILATDAAPSRARRKIREGDILVSMTRPNLNAVAKVPASLTEEICSTGFAVLRAGPKLDHDYLFHFVQTPGFVNALAGLTAGALYPAVTEMQVRQQPIPLPPLAEQQRIVEILDRAAAIQRLRRAAEEKAREIIPALFVDMFGDPATNPKGWPVAKLAKLARFVSGGTPAKANADYWIGDVPWVSPKDMKVWSIKDSQDHISQRVFNETSIKEIAAGAVLIVVRGMILAHTVPIAINERRIAINQDMKAIVSNGSVLPEYLLWALRTRHSELLNLVGTAAHGTKKIDTELLERFTILVPPLSLQRYFAAIVDKERDRIAMIKAGLAASDCLQLSLTATLLQ